MLSLARAKPHAFTVRATLGVFVSIDVFVQHHHHQRCFNDTLLIILLASFQL
jgi:hypothetical protein